MGKVIFEFDTIEDRYDISIINNANKFYFALDEIYNLCRNEIKYGEEEISEKMEDLLEEIKGIAGMIHDLEE